MDEGRPGGVAAQLLQAFVAELWNADGGVEGEAVGFGAELATAELSARSRAAAEPRRVGAGVATECDLPLHGGGGESREG